MTTTKQPPKTKRAGVSLLTLRTREIGAADFKARCLELMDEVERLGIEIVITKHRKPVARLVPARSGPTPFCGSLKHMIKEIGDVVSPTGEIWEADESNFT